MDINEQVEVLGKNNGGSQAGEDGSETDGSEAGRAADEVTVEQAKTKMFRVFLGIAAGAFLIGGIGAVALWRSMQGGSQAQAAETLATETQATETQETETQVTETQATETQPPETQATETQETEVVPADLTPPVIEGIVDLTVPAGGSLSYRRGVSARDDRDGEVQFTVDNSRVDLDTMGDYEVIYRAADAAGNEAAVTAVVHVTRPTAETATEEMVNAKAAEILAQITTADMSQKQVAEAIFWWCHDNIAYVDGSPKGSWVQGAYVGLFDRKGDCYTNYATAKCLLTQAGIENMGIQKIPTTTNNYHHYWNLINLGEGWYHFDSIKRRDGRYFFYSTDAELMEYSAANQPPDSHLYDPSLYPPIQ